MEGKVWAGQWVGEDRSVRVGPPHSVQWMSEQQGLTRRRVLLCSTTTLCPTQSHTTSR